MRPIGNLSRYTGGPLRRRGEWRCFMKSRKCSDRISLAIRVRWVMAARKGRAQVAQRVAVGPGGSWRPGVRVIAKQFGVDPGTVQRISRPFAAASVVVPPKIFSKEVAQKQATPFPRQDLPQHQKSFY